MNDSKIVWSSDKGDLRKRNTEKTQGPIDESKLVIEVRRLTSGKGRTMMELRGLPNDKSWCKKLAKNLKQKLGVGGAYKENYIEIHTADFEKLTQALNEQSLKWKKTGG